MKTLIKHSSEKNDKKLSNLIVKQEKELTIIKNEIKKVIYKYDKKLLLDLLS